MKHLEDNLKNKSIHKSTQCIVIVIFKLSKLFSSFLPTNRNLSQILTLFKKSAYSVVELRKNGKSNKFD